MENSEDKIYDIMKQDNVIFTIFKEIDTIVFDVSNSSTRLIRKILRNASQYEDTSIILDFEDHHSNNIMRRFIHYMNKIKSKKKAEVIFRFSSNDKSQNKLFNYLYLLPASQNSQEQKQLILFNPQYDNQISPQELIVKLKSDNQIIFTIEFYDIIIPCQIELDDETNQQIFYLENTKQKIFQNLDQIILNHLPLYGVSDNQINCTFKQLKTLTIFSKSNDVSTELTFILINEMINFQVYQNFNLDQFVISCNESLDLTEIYEKSMNLKTELSKTYPLKGMRIYNKYDQFQFNFEDINQQSLIMYITREVKSAEKYISLFNIDIELQNIKITLKNIDGKLDITDYILRCKQYHLIQDLEVILDYSNLKQINYILIGDVFDLLSKLKGIKSSSAVINLNLELILSLSYKKDDLTNSIVTTCQNEDIIKNIIFREEAKHLNLIFRKDNNSNIDSFNKTLLPLLKKSNMKNSISLTFYRWNTINDFFSLISSKEILNNFPYIQINFSSSTQFQLVKLDQEICQKVIKITVLDFNLRKIPQISSIIDKYPNLLQIYKFDENIRSYRLIQKQYQTFSKYFINKRLYTFILKQKKLQFKRIEVYQDLLLDFLS